MEFEVRLDSARGRLTAEVPPPPPPYRLFVRHEDWDELTNVLDEVVHEQREFDELLEARHAGGARMRRGFLVLMIIIVAFLAVFGLVKL